MASVSYDRDEKTLYIKLSEAKVVSTVPLGEGSYLDVSEDGKAVGLEIIFPRSTPQEAIDAIINADKSTKLFSNIFPTILMHQPLVQ